ncbi:MAG: hypothetical protein A2139_00235 [Desulfobacca sp. RBG_16_60_12]|nr:MAG: hypothetical protein A2139_00235 [Desulfobacca sp. RBG_16_60_12]
MARFFNFYDPLGKRYVFNSFLVVVGLVEILILVFTLIWKIDFDAMFASEVRAAVPFPWQEYLLAAFIAPIALLFLFGLIIQGFEVLGQGAPETGPGSGRWARLGRWRYLLGLLAFMAALVLFLHGKTVFYLLNATIKFIGLGGSYGLIVLLALALLYLPLRLWLRYRLQKQAMEYQYLLTLAERHGVVVVDPKLHPELAAELHEKKNISAVAVNLLPSANISQDPDPNKSDL